MRSCIALFALLLVAGDSQAFGRRRQAASYQSQPSSYAQPVAQDSSDFGATLLVLHNADRARQGLAPLALSDSLNQEAGAAAQEQYRRGRIGHWLSIRSGSENAAQGQSSESETHHDWMRSSGHRANILGPWREVGFARCGSFWTARYR